MHREGHRMATGISLGGVSAFDGVNLEIDMRRFPFLARLKGKSFRENWPNGPWKKSTENSDEICDEGSNFFFLTRPREIRD